MIGFEEITMISGVAPILVGAVSFRRLPLALKLLFGLTIYSAVSNIITASLAYNTINNMPFFHLYAWIEMIILFFIFWNILHSKKKKLAVVIIAIALIALSIVNLLFIERHWQFNGNQLYAEGLVMIFFSLLYFVQIFQEMKIKRMEDHPYFWMCSCMLIYFAGNLFLFIVMGKYGRALNTDYWMILHSSLMLLLNIGYTLTLWKGTRLTQS